MQQPLISFLIPSNNEEFINETVEDILKNCTESEVIVVLDGKWSERPIPQHERLTIIYVPKAIGQRAATNLAARLARAKYVAKTDAHCSFDKDFDKKMIQGFVENGDDCVMVSIMRNLWAFDWKCYHCGFKVYQGPKPKKCEQCGKGDKLRKKVVWIGKERPQSVSYAFDSAPHFQYFEAYKHREPYLSDKKKGCTETMSLQGSFFMSTREKYWKWELSDEKLGNWGNQGIELACACWLSGGRVLVNHNTWYAHMFRTKADFSFPWQNSGRETEKTKNNVWEKFTKMKHPTQIRPVSWLIRKFMPVADWNEEKINML